jgi:ABC-type multidrug transport system ATPase subunit
MPDFFGVYDRLTASEYLDFYAACYRQSKQRRTKVVAELLELIGLTERRDQLVDTLSRGLKQRHDIVSLTSTLGLVKAALSAACCLTAGG